MDFKICIVGCGNLSVRMHGPSLKKYAELHPDVELAACCDIDEVKAVFYKQKFGFSRHYTDMDRMLDTEKPQAVCLISPVKLTFELSCKILGRGYPLLMEKPPGMDSNETREMIRVAGLKNTPNQVAFNRRYMPLVCELKKLLDKPKGLNSAMDMQFRMLRVGRKDPDFSTTAIHGIDVVKFLAGSDYKTVHFRYQELSHMGNDVANIHLDCEFRSGTFAQLDFLPVSGVDVERLEVNMDNRIFYLNTPEGFDTPGKLLYIEKSHIILEQDGKDISGSGEEFILHGFYNENESFLDDIRNGRKPAGDIQSGLQSVEIAECIRKRMKEYNF